MGVPYLKLSLTFTRLKKKEGKKRERKGRGSRRLKNPISQSPLALPLSGFFSLSKIKPPPWFSFLSSLHDKQHFDIPQNCVFLNTLLSFPRRKFEWGCRFIVEKGIN